MRTINQIIGTIATGYILMFYSEFMFWARVKPQDSLVEWLSTWLLYSIMAFIFLSLLSRFRVASIWALFLVGSIFGWLTEGLIVQTAYESLPLSLSWTGLAWHAIITIMLGWYYVRRILAKSFWSILLLSAAIGTAYGIWSISWWVEPDGGTSTPVEFAAYAFITSLVLILAYWVHEKTVPGFFKPNRVLEILALILLIIYFLFVTIPSVPLASIILPVLLSIVFLALRHNHQTEPREHLIEKLPGTIKAWNYLELLAIPISATTLYTAAFLLDIKWHTNWVFYIITTPAGFILFIISMIKVWRLKVNYRKDLPPSI